MHWCYSHCRDGETGAHRGGATWPKAQSHRADGDTFPSVVPTEADTPVSLSPGLPRRFPQPPRCRKAKVPGGGKKPLSTRGKGGGHRWLTHSPGSPTAAHRGVRHRKTAAPEQVRVPWGLKPGADGRGPELALLLPLPPREVLWPPAPGPPRGRASPGPPAPPSPATRPRPHLARERSPGPAPGALGGAASERRPPGGHPAARARDAPPGLRAGGARPS